MNRLSEKHSSNTIGNSPSFYHAIVTLPVIIVFLVVFTCPVFAQMPLALFKKPPVVEVQFLDNTVGHYTIAGFFDPRIETLGAIESKSPIKEPFLEVNTSGGILSLKLARVRSLSVVSPLTIDVPSGADVKCFSLGSAAQYIADPPDWYKFGGETPQWHAVSLPHPNYKWCYIPGASWVWSTPNWSGNSGEVVLFRQEFELPADFYVVDARLVITADYRVEAIFLNQIEVPVSRKLLTNTVCEYNVRSLIKHGKNLLAIKSANDRRGGLNFAGVAWRLRILGFKKENPPEVKSPGVVVFLLNGDRVSGEIMDMDAEFAMVSTDYATIQISLKWIQRMLVNHASPTESKERKVAKQSFFSRIFGRQSVLAEVMTKPVVHHPIAWSQSEDQPRQPHFIGLRLKNGKNIKGRLKGIKDNKVVVQTEFGSQVSTSLDEIYEVLPNLPRKRGFLRYKEPDRAYVCRVVCLNGDQISGVVEDIEPTFLEVATPYAGSFRIPFEYMLKCEFPMNSKIGTISELKEWSKVKKRPFTIGVIGDPIGTTPYRTKEAREFYKQLLRVLSEIETKAMPINALKLVEPDLLTPDKIALLINIDAREHYYHTVKEPDDGYHVLMDYINQGGNILIMGSGVPFYYGYVASKGRWLTTTRGKTIMAKMGFDVVIPGEFNPQAMSFELPDNPAGKLMFRLNNPSQIGIPQLSHLPPEVEFPVSADSRFRAVVPGALQPTDQFFPVYELVDNHSKKFGSAMAIIKRKSPAGGSQFFIYVSYQLARASVNGQPFIDYLLPPMIQTLLKNY
ncbi:hypothetical protein J7M23_05605 [Candidatus Sumerlaeota bacterium]|nr:hypothetical protein [Candidatus Sumerlaeota bacterium]